MSSENIKIDKSPKYATDFVGNDLLEGAMFSIIGLIVLIFVLGFAAGIIRHAQKYAIEFITSMPVMQWVSYSEIVTSYFDNSGFWASVILQALYRRDLIEVRAMQGFENLIIISNRTFSSSNIQLCEFRLRFKLRKRKFLLDLSFLGAWQQEPEEAAA